MLSQTRGLGHNIWSSVHQFEERPKRIVDLTMKNRKPAIAWFRAIWLSPEAEVVYLKLLCWTKCTEPKICGELVYDLEKYRRTSSASVRRYS
jgi:hypothetical protein